MPQCGTFTHREFDVAAKYSRAVTQCVLSLFLLPLAYAAPTAGAAPATAPSTLADPAGADAAERWRAKVLIEQLDDADAPVRHRAGLQLNSLGAPALGE